MSCGVQGRVGHSLMTVTCPFVGVREQQLQLLPTKYGNRIIIRRLLDEKKDGAFACQMAGHTSEFLIVSRQTGDASFHPELVVEPDRREGYLSREGV